MRPALGMGSGTPYEAAIPQARSRRHAGNVQACHAQPARFTLDRPVQGVAQRKLREAEDSLVRIFDNHKPSRRE
jgi:hypothetical protein